MSILVSLRKLLSLGEPEVRPSLVEFAVYDYEPRSGDPACLTCWQKLQSYLEGVGVPDEAITGLRSFLTQVIPTGEAQVCLSLNCEVSFDVTGGTICMDNHQDGIACCSAQSLLEELDRLVAAYDRQYTA